MSSTTVCTAYDTSKLGSFLPFDASSTTQSACSSSSTLLLGSPFFYGKTEKGEPIYALMDYSEFKMAKMALVASAVTAAILGVGCIALGIKAFKRP